MNDAYVTIVGWLAADPICRTTTNGIPFSSLRIGCTPRSFDRQTGQWQDMSSMFVTVNCWRALADNVRISDMKRGQPVVVTGKLRIREYVRGEELRTSTEIEAVTLGFDMSRGISRFERVSRGGAATDEDRQEVRESTDIWASSAGPAPVPSGDPAPGEGPLLGGMPEGYPGGGGTTTDDGEGDRDGDGDAEEEYDSYDVQARAA